MKFMLASSNVHKKNEFDVLMKPCEILIPDSFAVEENGSTYSENARIKLQALLDLHLGGVDVCFADDSGIEISALSNRPGIHSSRFMPELSQREKNLKIIELLSSCEDRSARFRTSLAFSVDGRTILFADGVMEGSIAFEPAGDGGFGYDPIFIPKGEVLTTGQLGDDFKNTHSHRAKAVMKMLDMLRDRR